MDYVGVLTRRQLRLLPRTAGLTVWRHLLHVIPLEIRFEYSKNKTTFAKLIQVEYLSEQQVQDSEAGDSGTLYDDRIYGRVQPLQCAPRSSGNDALVQQPG